MPTLGERAFSAAALHDVWLIVLANDEEDGLLSASIARFADAAQANLEALASELSAVTYRPAQLTAVTIQSGAKERELHIPGVRDRIVARAILAAVSPLIDPHLGSAAYAYRAGLGVADAVQAVTGLRQEGLRFVVRTDIRDCFPTLPKESARRRFAAIVGDERLTTMLDRLLERRFRTPTGGLRTLDGVPQGCPLSPLLANLVLVDVDSGLQHAGFPCVRYADDLLVAAASEAEAQEAARLASELVKGLGMEVNSEKTRVTSFDEGFTFLGEDFGPRYPPHLEDHRVHEPDEKVLYAGVQGGRVRIANGRILVESKDDAELLDVPSSQVSRIVCFGSVGLSAGARGWALGQGIDVVFASRSGNYLGTMLSHEHRYRPARLRAQLACADSDRALTIGRAIIEAKVTKQQVVLQRMNRRPGHESIAEAVAHMKGLLLMLPDAKTPDEIMGIEGAAASQYFPSLGALMPDELRFVERSRQPPQDVANSALSYLYTLLLGECVTALHAAGLDPAIGVLHADADNRPSLALDLMEEFRPWLVDQVVAEAARQGRLRPEHGRREPDRGVLLTKEGKSVLVDAYEKRLLGEVSGALSDFGGTRRRHLHRQAQRLRAAIMDPGSPWTGLSWRP